MKIGTHNSCTGESGGNLLSMLVTPFAKCQSKTLAEQWEAGCRYFDIRAKWIGDILYPAHGLWRAEYSLCYYLSGLNAYAQKEGCWIMLTYEGRLDTEEERQKWLNACTIVASKYPHLYISSINVKKPSWRCLVGNPEAPVFKQGFVSMVHKNWKKLLLVFPYVIDKVWTSPHEFNDDEYTLVDFL